MEDEESFKITSTNERRTERNENILDPDSQGQKVPNQIRRGF